MTMSKTSSNQSKRRLTELLDPQFMARLDALDFVSRKIIRGKIQGERRSKKRGQSVEFADHRPYVQGDDLRFVDWNIYGRLEQLFLKLFIEEQDLTVHIVLDLSASMATGDPSKEQFVKRMAAALGYISLVNNNRVTVSSFAEGISGELAHMRGRPYLSALAEFLLTRPCEGQSDFDASCRALTQRRLGTGIMIVLSDFFFKEGFESGLKRLVSRHYDLYVIQTLSPQEVDPKLSGDLKLVDIEDADMAEITASRALLTYYKRNLTAYCNEIKQFSTRRGGAYVLAQTSDSIESLILNYLRKIQLLS
jgi:uncharacterized protein (DUF58 family)